MTFTDYSLVFTEIFGPPDPEQPSDKNIRHYCGGAVSVDTVTKRYTTIIEVDGRRIGLFDLNIEGLTKLIKTNGGGDWHTALTKKIREENAAEAEEEEEKETEKERREHEAAAIVNDILTGRLKPEQDKSGKWCLDLGSVAVEDNDLPNYTTEELADFAIEAFRDLGIYLPCFDTGRKFTDEEKARVRASLPQPEEPELEPGTNPPAAEVEAKAEPDHDEAERVPALNEEAPAAGEETAQLPSEQPREVREFIITLADQAKAATKHLSDPGVWQMILVHPNTEGVGTIYRYKLSDPELVERMTREAVSASEAGHNVYIEGRTVRRGLGPKQRGKLEDTVAVFALVVDSDNDKGKAWPPTVPTSLAVETSPDNA